MALFRINEDLLLITCIVGIITAGFGYLYHDV